jgi:hypothetical protein
MAIAAVGEVIADTVTAEGMVAGTAAMAADTVEVMAVDMEAVMAVAMVAVTAAVATDNV